MLGCWCLSFHDYALGFPRQTALWITLSLNPLVGDHGAMDAKTTQRTLPRARRQFWFDPRFAIGFILVLASVAGVVFIVSTADATTLVYAARETLSPGDRVTASDLRAASVRLDAVEGLYLLPGDVPDSGVVVTKPVAAGELVPASAVGATAGLSLASVVVALSGELPGSVEPGTTVDLWSSREIENGAFGPPTVIVSTATVVRVVEADGLVAGETVSIELLVPRLRIARVLEAIANEDALSVVPTSIPAKG
jgi:SAF domain